MATGVVPVNPMPSAVMDGSGFGIPKFDYVTLGYTGANLTSVNYYYGGPTGILVATLTLAYDIANNLISVQRS